MKYEISVVAFILVFHITATAISTVAEPVNPNLNYYSNPPFEVEKYNTSAVIENAKRMGYAIKIESVPASCKNPLPDGGCLGKDWVLPIYAYINSDGTSSYLSSPKRLGVNNQSHVGLHVSSVDIEFSAGPKSFTDQYLFTAGFRSTNFGMTTEEASDIIVNELKVLGILDQDTNLTIRFESYSPPILFSDGNSQSITFSFIIIVIVVAILIILITRGRRKSP